MSMETPNLKYIYDMSGGDKVFEEKMISIIKAELPKEILQFNEAIDSDELQLAAQSVHKLKHKIGLMGLDKSYLKANEFEQNLNANSQVLREEFMDILNNMTIFINSL